MKIAICSSQDKLRKKLVLDFLNEWPMYKTPAKTIDDEIEWPDDIKALDITKEKLNDAEKALFSKLLLLSKQYADYKDEKYMIYNGCSIDVLLNTVLLNEEDIVSDEFVEKIIYYNKSYLKNLDAVYWQPVNEKLNNNDDKRLEMMYENLYNNYYEHFDDSIYFDKKHTPGFIKIETENPIDELKIIVDQKGNFISDMNEDEMLDMQRMMKVLRNKTLIEGMMKGCKSYSIPIIGE